MAEMSRRPMNGGERPSHPPVAAAVLMVGIVLFLVLVSVVSAL